MATYDNRSFLGEWRDYQNRSPQIFFNFTGYRNGNLDNVGCNDGTVGGASYTMTATGTYGSLWGVDGKHAKCCIAAWYNGAQWILNPIGFPNGWKTFTNKRIELKRNSRTGRIPDLEYITVDEVNAPELQFRYQNDEYPFYDNRNIQYGTKEFGAQITANCPIIRTESNRNLVTLKDGSQVPLTTSILLENIDASAFLNGKDLGESTQTEWFIDSECWKYNVDAFGNKTDEVNMLSRTYWKESNSDRQSSPYLVETEFNGIPCLKLYPTLSESGLSVDDFTTNKKANYGAREDLDFLFSNLYKPFEAAENAILKTLGYYYLNKYVEKPVGDHVEVIQGLFLNTNIPIFRNDQEGSEWSYENSYGDKERADELLDKNSVNRVDKGDVYKPIGNVLDNTPIDAGYTQQAMSTQYAMDTSSLIELANNLFNTDVSVQGALQDGLKMYGANPINCVIDLQYYPFDVPAFIQNSVDNYIYFGSYKMDFSNSFNKLYNTKCVIDCGSVIYPEQTGTYLDYEPYTELYVYLPYVGVQKLDVNTYNGKVINLKYIVDIQTGMCEAVLFCNNIITDNFGGNIGAKQCISSIDYASYAQNKAQNLHKTANSILQFAEGGAAMIGGGIGSGVDAANGFYGFAKGMTDLYMTQNAQHISIRGSVTPTTAFAMPQYAYFYTVKQDVIFPDNEQELIGYPSNTGGKVRDFKGFLQCSKVSLNTTATENEKAKLYSLLQNGIYI